MREMKFWYETTMLIYTRRSHVKVLSPSTANVVPIPQHWIPIRKLKQPSPSHLSPFPMPTQCLLDRVSIGRKLLTEKK